MTDIHHDRLCDGNTDLASKSDPATPEPPKPKECPQCHYVRGGKINSCPKCGHVPEVRTGVETVDGELVDLSARRKANREMSWGEKVAFMAELKAYAKAHNHQEGWVAHKYRAKTDVWPNDNRLRGVVPARVVSPETASWIRAQNIRHAKRRAS